MTRAKDIQADSSGGPAATPPAAGASGARAQARYGKLQSHFELNAGQFRDSVKFGARGAGYQLAFTANEVLLSLHRSAGMPADPRERIQWLRKSFRERQRGHSGPPGESVTLIRKAFVGANPNPDVVGEDRLPGVSHYLLGSDPRKWINNVPHYARVRYRNVYPGIDLVYYGTDGRLEYDWIIAPGVDPHRIVESFSGVTGLKVLDNGDLFVQTSAGGFRQRKPAIYQVIHGARIPVEGGYVVVGGSEAAFKVGRYDQSRPLFIDPVLEYSTLLDGTFSDTATGIAVNASGEAYITGYSMSSDFPHTATVFAPAGSLGIGGAFVTKLNAAGDAIVYSIYFGSDGFTAATGIALGADGSAYATGITQAAQESEPPFAIIPGAEFPATATIGNVNFIATTFVAKIAPDGSGFGYATAIGGAACIPSANSIAVDSAGSAFVAGSTDCADWPTTLGALQTSRSSTTVGTADGFVLKLSPDGTALAYSTLYGGAELPGSTGDSSGQTSVMGIAIDAGGYAYIAGATNSPFLPLANAYQGVYAGGGMDGFFAKIDPSGSSLIYSSYYGGSGGDNFRGIAVDGQGNALILGYGGGFFPVVNPIPGIGSVGGAVVVKVNQTGAVSFATSLGAVPGPTASGPMNGLGGRGIAVDRLGSIYVTSDVFQNTLSPTIGDLGLGGGTDSSITDAFISKLSADGSTLAYSFPLGGSQGAKGLDIAVDPLGGVYVIGEATQNFPTENAIQTTAVDGAAFVAKFFEPLPPIGIFSSLNPSVVGQEVTFTAIVPNDSATGTVTFFDGATALATVALVSGAAKFTTSALSIATHPMTAAYSGDANNPAATSSVFNQQVNPPAQDSATALSASSASLPANGQLVLTAIVTGTTGTTPTGLVMFLDGTGRIATASLVSGTASITVRNPTPGQHSMTASYLGDGLNNPSVSPPLTVNVIGPPTVSVTYPINNSAFAYPASLSVTVDASAQTGASLTEVDLFLNGAQVASFTSAPDTFPWANAPPGTYVFTAQAVDNFGQSSTSVPVSVKIYDAGLTFFHHDLEGNVIAATDALGQVLYTETYQPFGARIIKSSSSSDTATNGNRLWFGGKAQDEGTGLSYFGARYYDPTIGRFMGADSAGFNESNLHSFNRYAYGNNNPYRYTDPDGRNPALMVEITFDVTFAVATRLGAAAVGAWIGNRLWDLLHNEAQNPNETPGATGQVNSPGTSSDSSTSGSSTGKDVTKRPSKVRKGTEQANWDNAENGPIGGKLCPDCKEEVQSRPGEKNKDWDNDHNPPWRERNLTGKDRKGVLDEYNRDTRLRCVSCNRSDNGSRGSGNESNQ